MTSPDVYVSLGSNIAPERSLAEAVRLLRQKCDVLALSSVYRTAPQGYADQPDFLNMAVKLHTALPPEIFKREVLDWIERRLGRVRDPLNKNAPRTIDLDISLWGSAVFTYGDRPWRVPDPDIVRFAHVAVPLAELSPDFLHPTEGLTLAALVARFKSEIFERFVLTI
ncbi:MAG: 2-amino-4-hydroxy-6-hydroxymethyldihydropteridine diphosphokinase [Chloroflexota bacterium]|nr:MAG: 2-amino-4-hydroxy-6-hydroxymethyldihydropteridine diphosphokinase [Chloroflexota bacterium]